MATEEEDQITRAEFYTSPPVAKYILANGRPRTSHAFSDMVASGSSENLTSKKGLALIACLGRVAFFTHPQQLNIMDQSNGKIIVSLKR
jgi:hypothetical protein